MKNEIHTNLQKRKRRVGHGTDTCCARNLVWSTIEHVLRMRPKKFDLALGGGVAVRDTAQWVTHHASWMADQTPSNWLRNTLSQDWTSSSDSPIRTFSRPTPMCTGEASWMVAGVPESLVLT
eukprot:764848-Hanusia_phi.AAC.1